MSELTRLRAILDSIRVGIVAVDAEGSVDVQTAEASRILGVSAKVTRGTPLAEVLGPRHPAVGLLREALEHGRDLWLHAVSIPPRSSGEPLTVDLAVSPVRDEAEGGDVTAGAVLTLSDRTQGQELAAIVDQRTRSELFARLASGIAHEIRNPLGGIRGAAELLLGRLDDPDLQRYPELIRDETDRVRRLLDDLSQLTDHRELNTQRVNLHRVLDDLLELQRHDDAFVDVSFVREYDPSIPELDLDPDRMAQVFLNLVRNAAQAMQGKGTLRLRTRVHPALHISNEVSEPAGVFTVDVLDEGTGISDEDLPHIFTPFFSRRGQGTGMGLAIAQHWTVRHGGRIQAHSSPGAGTRMRVLLPVRRRE